MARAHVSLATTLIDRIKNRRRPATSVRPIEENGFFLCYREKGSTTSNDELNIEESHVIHHFLVRLFGIGRLSYSLLSLFCAVFIERVFSIF